MDPDPEPAVPAPIVPAARRGKRASRPARRWWAAAIGVGVALAAVAAGLAVSRRDGPPAPAASAPATDSGRPPPQAQDPTPAIAETAPEPEATLTCPDLSGHWTGRWAASRSRGTWTADFRQERRDGGGVELHGDIRVRGTSCGSGGHIVGQIGQDCSVEFDPYSTGRCRVRYEATFEGDTMRGTLTASAFGMADRGRWSGARRGPARGREAP